MQWLKQNWRTFQLNRQTYHAASTLKIGCHNKSKYIKILCLFFTWNPKTKDCTKREIKVKISMKSGNSDMK
jgi:hypothetical protein